MAKIKDIGAVCACARAVQNNAYGCDAQKSVRKKLQRLILI